MSDYKYVYKNPLDQGCQQFKLTRKQHNALFKYRQMKWYHRYEYYYNEHKIIMHRFVNIYGIILQTIMFPILVLLEGLGDIKQIIEEYKKLYNQKKYGSFRGDNIWSDSDKYKEIMNLING